MSQDSISDDDGVIPMRKTADAESESEEEEEAKKEPVKERDEPVAKEPVPVADDDDEEEEEEEERKVAPPPKKRKPEESVAPVNKKQKQKPQQSEGDRPVVGDYNVVYNKHMLVALWEQGVKESTFAELCDAWAKPSTDPARRALLTRWEERRDNIKSTILTGSVHADTETKAAAMERAFQTLQWLPPEKVPTGKGAGKRGKGAASAVCVFSGHTGTLVKVGMISAGGPLRPTKGAGCKIPPGTSDTRDPYLIVNARYHSKGTHEPLVALSFLLWVHLHARRTYRSLHSVRSRLAEESEEEWKQTAIPALYRKYNEASAFVRFFFMHPQLYGERL
jgi:hypothetical protein